MAFKRVVQLRSFLRCFPSSLAPPRGAGTKSASCVWCRCSNSHSRCSSWCPLATLRRRTKLHVGGRRRFPLRLLACWRSRHQPMDALADDDPRESPHSSSPACGISNVPNGSSKPGVHRRLKPTHAPRTAGYRLPRSRSRKELRCGGTKSDCANGPERRRAINVQSLTFGGMPSAMHV